LYGFPLFPPDMGLQEYTGGLLHDFFKQASPETGRDYMKWSGMMDFLLDSVAYQCYVFAVFDGEIN